MEAKLYGSMSSAKRGAERAKIANPVFTKLDDGKIALTEAIAAKAEGTGPVATFREIFTRLYGTVKRSDVIAEAVAKGISKNTAATYYQKLKAAL